MARRLGILKTAGEVVEVVYGRHGGVDVFVRPRTEPPDRREPDDGNTQWRAWFQSLSESCVC